MENSIIDVGGPLFDVSENPFVMDDSNLIDIPTPKHTISFDNGTKEAVIDFDGDEVTYSGDLMVDESAKLLFDAMFKRLKPRCKTCRWYDTGSWHQCYCPKMVYGYGRDRADKDGLDVEDDEGWGMLPGPDFGCVHHEENS